MKRKGYALTWSEGDGVQTQKGCRTKEERLRHSSSLLRTNSTNAGVPLPSIRLVRPATTNTGAATCTRLRDLTKVLNVSSAASRIPATDGRRSLSSDKSQNVYCRKLGQERPQVFQSVAHVRLHDFLESQHCAVDRLPLHCISKPYPCGLSTP